MIVEELRAMKLAQQLAQQEMKLSQQEMKEHLALAVSASMSSPSAADLGRRVWESCQIKSERITGDVSSLQPAPILTAAAYKELHSKFECNPGAQQAGSKEQVWVALVTPTLMQLLASHIPHLRLVNSELIKWIRTESNLPDYFQKPDLFICDDVAYIAASPPLIQDKSSASNKYAASIRDPTFLFGSCAWPLRDAVRCLLEAKVKISIHENIGEIFPKIQNLLRYSHRASHKCVLFDITDIQLLTFTSTGLQSSQRFAWTDSGSAQMLLDFISPVGMLDPVWLSCLRCLCVHFHAQPVPGQSFLGAGAHGKVFRVRPVEDVSAASAAAAAAACSSSAAAGSASAAASALSSELRASVLPGIAPSGCERVVNASCYALKVVDSTHLDSLDAERFKLHTIVCNQVQAAAASVTPLAAPRVGRVLPTYVSDVHRVSGVGGQPMGAGLLLAPVGSPLSLWNGSKQCSKTEGQALLTELLDALLLLHRAGISHGDARLENVVRVASVAGGGSLESEGDTNAGTTENTSHLVWIDFRESVYRSSVEAEQWWDFQVCLKSFFKHYHRKVDSEPQWSNQSQLKDTYLAYVRDDSGLTAGLVQAAWAVVVL